MVQFGGNALSSTLSECGGAEGDGQTGSAHEGRAVSGDGLSHCDRRIDLTVTPQISVDGVVHLSDNPSVTQENGVATSPSGVAVPIITVREADTVAHILLTPTLMAR